VPTPEDKQLNVIITPPTIVSGGTGANQPFPASTNSMTFTGLNGLGNAQVEFVVDIMLGVPAGKGYGLWLPRWQNKIISFQYASTKLDEQQILNWDRGGFWHAMFFNEYERISTGYQVVYNDIPNTILRDFKLLADSEEILEDSLAGRIAKQTPYIPLPTAYGMQTFDPVLINLNSGKSAFSLPDFAAYRQATKQINMEFNNVNVPQITNNTAYTRYVSVMTLRYVPR
jgi:hypothetical protein